MSAGTSLNLSTLSRPGDPAWLRALALVSSGLNSAAAAVAAVILTLMTLLILVEIVLRFFSLSTFMADTPKNVCGIIDRLTEIGDKNDKVSIGDIVGAFGSRSYGPVFLVPALIGVSPVGGIPGVPTFLAATLLLIAVQLVFGKDHLWLPGVLKNRSVEGEKLANAAEDMEGVARRMDKIFHGRLEMFTATKRSELPSAFQLTIWRQACSSTQ